MKTLKESKELIIQNIWTGCDGVLQDIRRDAFAAGAEKMREKIATHYGGEERLYPDEVRAVDLPPFPEDQP